MIITSTTSPIINYSLDNEKLYPKSLLDKIFRNIFITIPHTQIDPKILLDKINTTLKCSYIIVCQEKHQDQDTHLHILIIFIDKSRLKPVHNIIKNLKIDIRGSINYQSAKDIQNVITYIKKDNLYYEVGVEPIKTGKVGKQRTDATYQEKQDIHYSNILSVIEETKDKEKALQYFKENCPRDYFMNSEKVESQIDKLLTPKPKKFNFIKYTDENTTLNNWQLELFTLVQSSPKPRRIIWIYGDPGIGKSFMFNYLTDNYEYGVYSAGQSCSLDNLAYSYKEEGIIAWDLPMNFNFTDDNMRLALCNVIEKFSDFGQIITSKKYTGNKVRILGHAVVFSNHPSPTELSHRDLHVIRGRPRINYKNINNKFIVEYKNNNTSRYFYYDTEKEMNEKYYIELDKFKQELILNEVEDEND